MENAQPEPSMEEILASIRRIISEDEEDASADIVEPGKPSLVQDAPQSAESGGDAIPQPAPETEDVEMIKQNVAEAVQHEAEEAMLDENAASAASNAFDALSDSVRVSDGAGKTLEQIVVEMLRPMVKDWLDANLPAIVEEKVEDEVKRVARRRR